MNHLRTSFFKHILLGLLFCIVPVSVQSRVLMVSVGVNDYHQPGVSSLRLAENDARDFARLMSSDKNADIRLILGPNATKATVLRQLGEIAAKARPDDVLCLFFSGHGLKGGMALTDTRSYGSLLTYKEISQIFKTSPARQKLIFADTCHSGSMRIGKKKATSEDLNRLKSQNILLFLSSRDNETSREAGRGMRNGIFTTYLLSGLEGSADTNRDGRVTAKELFTFVSRRVRSATGNQQHPVMWGKFDSDMILTTVQR